MMQTIQVNLASCPHARILRRPPELQSAKLRSDAIQIEHKDIAMTHKFAVGQIVNLIPSKLRSAAPGDYEVVRRMPGLDSNPDNPSYRVKSIDEKHERVATERELTFSMQPASVFSSSDASPDPTFGTLPEPTR